MAADDMARGAVPSWASDPWAAEETPERSSEGDDDVTGLLLAWRSGDGQAAERLMATVYDELHTIARMALRKQPGQTLQATALINEAYLRLIDQKRVEWHNRNHFFAIAACIMRRIAIDYARRRQAKKRGAEVRISLAGLDPAAEQPGYDAEALEDALRRLTERDPVKASVVELRFFGGLKVREVADVLGCSKATVERHWAFARAWLYRELR